MLARFYSNVSMIIPHITEIISDLDTSLSATATASIQEPVDDIEPYKHIDWGEENY